MQQRAETGVLEFEGDWPGVFIRGDNAMMYAMTLRLVLESLPKDFGDAFARMYLKGLLELMESSNVRSGNHLPQKVKWLPIEPQQ